MSNIPTFDTPLIAPTGYIEYDRTDGKHIKETWCQLKVSTLVSNMKYYEGIDLPYWIRDDGVRMYGPFTIVASDVKSRVNPWTGGIAYKGGTCEYGDIVATSLGLGIIMDYGEDAVNYRVKTGGAVIRYETYTAWAEAPYNSMVYAPNYEPKNYAYNPQLIGNPKLGNLAKNPEILPEGWEKLINNPDCLKEVWDGVMKNCESISNSSGSSASSSKPSTSVGSSTSGSSAVSCSSSLNTSISNILPNNKFSNALPELKSGNLGSMEISQNSINYEVHNVDDYIYSDYVKSLIDQGYTMTHYGTFIKGNYQVVTKITKDGNMSISLIII